MSKDEQYMKRALDIARFGLGNVSPNPMVGCVIVYEDNIIGEGWHKKFGGPHAEVYAVNNVEDKSLLHGSSIYINLEPCSYHGKTPACTDMLTKHKVKRVVISNRDPNPRVSGSGIQQLLKHKIKIKEGILWAEGRELNRRFFTNQEKERPYVILKWAQTADGFIAKENRDSKWISSDASRKIVHKWRAEEDAILVGRGTVQFDNPTLNVRDWEGNNPVRIVIDTGLKLDNSYLIFDQRIETIVYNYVKDQIQGNLIFRRINKDNFLEGMLNDLNEKGLGSIIVEGGAATLNNFIKAGLWDEARVFVSPEKFEKGIEAPKIIKDPESQEMIAEDKLYIYRFNATENGNTGE